MCRLTPQPADAGVVINMEYGYTGDLILEIKGGFADEFAASKTTIAKILASL